MAFLSKQPVQKQLSLRVLQKPPDSVEKTKIYGARRKSCTGGSVLIASFVLFFCEGSLKCLIWKENGDKSLPETEIILGRQKNALCEHIFLMATHAPVDFMFFI